MAPMKRVALGALLLAGSISAAAAQWMPWPPSPESPMSVDLPPVAAGYKHGDGGVLVVACDTRRKRMWIGLHEPRARWQPGAPIDVTTRTDTGASTGPLQGVVTDSSYLRSEQQPALVVRTMDQAKGSFAVTAGGYERIYLMENFRKMVDPVLSACGEHF